jgi:hypothetical protein
MPTNRFNYSDDFVLNNGKVGINSASPQEKLDVVGVTRAENLSVVGVSSLTGYEGFLRANHNIAENTSLEGGQGTTGSLSGEIVIGTGVTVTGVTTATSGQGYIDTLKVYNTFTVPVGLTTDRPTAPKPGQLYYNKDFATIEFFDGDRWRQVDNTTQRGRGVLGNGQGGTTLDFVQIHTLGNAQRFGNLSVSRGTLGSASNSTRGLFAGGGSSPLDSNVIDYITLASEGNAIDFGDLTRTAKGIASGTCSSSTRGLFAGGYITTPAGDSTNVIDYVQIGTLGNALDFGDLSASGGTGVGLFATCSSPTRGIFAGGYVTPLVRTAEIHSITISSTGNTVSFGNLTQGRYSIGGCSNATRGIFVGGFNPTTNIIEYVNIASSGNATYFGDATQSASLSAAVSTSTRGVFSCSGPSSNVINYITISSTGNALDFGDLTELRYTYASCSDSHGGLGGF